MAEFRRGVDAAVLAPDYRRIVAILAKEGGEATDCRKLAAALGLAVVPAKVEGVHSKAKRLARRGWLTEAVPGMFSPRGRARRRLMTMLIDHQTIASTLSVRAS